MERSTDRGVERRDEVAVPAVRHLASYRESERHRWRIKIVGGNTPDVGSSPVASVYQSFGVLMDPSGRKDAASLG